VTRGPEPRGRHRRRAGRRAVIGRRAAAAGLALVVLAVLAAIGLDVSRTTSGNARGASTSSPTSTTRGDRTSGTAAAPPRNSVTIAAVGDTELGNTPDLPPHVSTYLAPIAGALKAPIVFGNLEGTLTDSASSHCAPTSTGCLALRVPMSYAHVMRQAGFTVLNSANDHAHDFGARGVSDTTAALHAAGIVQAGLPGQIGIVTDGATKVAFVDFAPYADVNDMLAPGAARLLIAKARTEAPVVVVSMHAGAEGSDADHVTGQEEHDAGENRGNAEAFAHAAIDDGADLVLASGPQVLRGMEYYDAHLIAYSLGDFAGYHDFPAGGDLRLSGILKVTLDARGGLVGGHFTSVVLDGEGRPSVDPSGAAARFVNLLSAADFGRDAVDILPDGDLVPPAV